jgi:two-component system, cell cycle response regulator
VGLRARLALFFVAITVVPLTVAVVALQFQIDRQVRTRAAAELTSFRAAVTALIDMERLRAGDVATNLARQGVAAVLDEGDPARATAWLENEAAGALGERADFVLLVTPDGRPLAALLAGHRLASELAPPDPDAIAGVVGGGAAPPGVLAEVREVRGAGAQQPERLIGWVVAGRWTDGQMLNRLPIGGGAGFAADGVLLAAVGARPGDLPVAGLPPPGAVEEVRVGEDDVLLTTAPLVAGTDTDAPTLLLVWAPGSVNPLAWRFALLLLLPSVAVAATLGWLIAGGVIAPIRRAADVARSVAAGDLHQKLEPTGGRELRDLAVALNTMSADLAARLEEIERSRDVLRGSLARLGQTLSSSLDLNRTLAVVVETAMSTLRAHRAVLSLLTPERDALYTKVARGLDSPQRRLRIGEGRAGYVVDTGKALRLPADEGSAPQPVPGEPTGEHQLIVPMHGRGRVVGVLSLLRDDAAAPFTRDDLNTMRSFAAHISVAIENVLLHQEAQRLSVTDPLTGLWNFRYFQQQAEREIESSSRYGRPLSLVIVDIDHFKDINDRYGHQVGDEVLVEIAARLRDATRAPDIVARYGGEEFVVLLPGADIRGAVATAERIRLAVGETAIPVMSRHVSALTVTCSGGVASFPNHGGTVAALLRSADAAMYQAKQRGRNRIVAAETAGVET